jgi:glycosyltransferase involved in cell wall biosynthesis
MLNKDKPLVSIAICTYNGEKFLIKQLESLVNQTYTNLEIIAVDDDSRDKTVEILSEYALKYPSIKVYKNDKNLGYVKNFEKALTLCSGQFIALCDQDDIWELEKITILVNQIKDSDLIYHNSDFIDDKDLLIEGVTMSDHYKAYKVNSNLPFLIANCIAGHSMLIKSSLVSQVLPFNKDFHHDWWIAFIAATVGKIKAIPDILAHYRQHERSITDSLGLRQDSGVKKYGPLIYNLKWIEHCLNFDNQKNPDEVLYIYQQLSAYEQNKTGLRMFLFLAKYYEQLFYLNIKKKSYLSKLNHLRKICFSTKHR